MVTLEKNGTRVVLVHAADIQKFKTLGYAEVEEASKVVEASPEVAQVPEDLNVKQLKAIAKEIGLKGYGKFGKDQLIEAIQAFEEGEA